MVRVIFIRDEYAPWTASTLTLTPTPTLTPTLTVTLTPALACRREPSIPEPWINEAWQIDTWVETRVDEPRTSPRRLVSRHTQLRATKRLPHARTADLRFPKPCRAVRGARS